MVLGELTGGRNALGGKCPGGRFRGSLRGKDQGNARGSPRIVHTNRMCYI